MKLYRIVPDTFNLSPLLVKEKNILGPLNFYTLEELYYKLGFMSFFKNENLDGYIPQEYFNNETMSFFCSPKNAIKSYIQELVKMNLKCCNVVLMEYNFPRSIISNYIKNGYYNSNGLSNKQILEIMIPNNELKKLCKKSIIGININKEKLKEVFYDSLFDSVNYLKLTAIDLQNNKLGYIDVFYLIDLLENYYKLFNCDNLIQQIKNSTVYQSFFNNVDNIMFCPFITGNMNIINGTGILPLININNDISINNFLSTKDLNVLETLNANNKDARIKLKIH